MIKISFPNEKPAIEFRDGVNEIFDPVRKKWLLLTPEEWVRQNMIGYLLKTKNYPKTLIAVEKEIRLGELRKRCDLVIYNRRMNPWMIVECKEMNVPLSIKTVEQILAYHMALPAEYLVITNGSFTRGFKKENGRFIETSHFPEYNFSAE